MGHATGVVSFALDSPQMAAAEQRLADGPIDRDFLTTIGGTLSDALFTGEVRDLYHESLGRVQHDDDEGLRLRLCIDPPALSALPWELAYDRTRDTFLATSTETPLTRYINLHEPIDELRTAPPISVLVAIPDGSGLDVAMERAIIEDALSALGDAVTVVALEGNVTRSAISQALLAAQHHVFHFIGHGRFSNNDGYLVLNAEDGTQEDLIAARSFAGFFRDYQSMKLVVLNACQGAAVASTRPLAGIAPQLVRAGIPSVVAMQYPFADTAAVLFAREFYRKLCTGSNRGRVDAAVSHARNRLQMDFVDTLAFATPVLYMRSPTGVIFDLATSQRAGQLLARGDDIDRLKAVRPPIKATSRYWWQPRAVMTRKLRPSGKKARTLPPLMALYGSPASGLPDWSWRAGSCCSLRGSDCSTSSNWTTGWSAGSSGTWTRLSRRNSTGEYR